MAFIHGRNLLTQGRTRRSLRRAFGPEIARPLATAELAEALSSAGKKVAMAEGGTWFRAARGVPDFPDEGEWICVGAWLGAHPAAETWKSILARSGGNLSRIPWWRKAPPAPPAMLFSSEAARRFGRLLAKGGDMEKAWRSILRSGIRIAHLDELDAAFCDSLRVVQLVTSIQIGGAERVALDLAEGMPAHGATTLVVTIGKPLREAFAAPAGLVDLSSFRSDTARLASEIERTALAFGADLIHAHLIRASEARAMSGAGFPLMLHLHNMPAGWPPDYASLHPDDAAIVVACSQRVEAAARKALPAMNVRTVWNGIAPVKRIDREKIDAFTVVTIANPRRQKRLERIPAIAAATARLAAPRRVRFIIAGARDAHSNDSAEAIAALEAAISAHDAAQWLVRPGIITDRASLLAEADAMLSVSDFEGLSLAHLEALSAGVPLVATDAGGTREIAAQSNAVRLLPLDATAGDFAAALLGCERGTASLPPSFSLHKMCARAAWLAAAAVRCAERAKPEGLWLIANNFSTGGAQTSARRLLIALRERGIRVRAAVIQEQPQFPTPGRRALIEAGISVLAVPPADGRPVEEAATPLLDAIANDPPEAVFFWNVISSWKVLLADALPGTRIFDISPGEMLFSSLNRFFEKPGTGLPYVVPQDYGARLTGMVVKYRAELSRAATLGAPVFAIPNGVPTRPPAKRPDSGKLILGTAARLSPDKKLGELFAALRIAAPNLPPFVLRVAGGPERDFPDHASELRRCAEGLPVEWLGEVADIPAFLDSLNIFLMISEPAGCPNATLEAAAAGLPIIATDHGGVAEQVIDGVTGRLVPRANEKAFADALVELGNAPEKCAKMGEAGRDFITASFSMTEMAAQYAGLICGKSLAIGNDR